MTQQPVGEPTDYIYELVSVAFMSALPRWMHPEWSFDGYKHMARPNCVQFEMSHRALLSLVGCLDSSLNE